MKKIIFVKKKPYLNVPGISDSGIFFLLNIKCYVTRMYQNQEFIVRAESATTLYNCVYDLWYSKGMFDIMDMYRMYMYNLDGVYQAGISLIHSCLSAFQFFQFSHDIYYICPGKRVFTEIFN